MSLATAVPQSKLDAFQENVQRFTAVLSTWIIKLLLLPPVLVGAYVGAAFDFSLGRHALELGNKMFFGEVTETQGVVGLLEAVDGLLLVSVLVLIVFGTYWIYMIRPQSEDGLPSALQGLTSGKLKEKLSSSLITASAVYLFKIVIQLTAPEGDPAGDFSVKNAIILGSFHLLFVLGYYIISHSNRHDPHKHPLVPGLGARLGHSTVVAAPTDLGTDAAGHSDSSNSHHVPSHSQEH